MKKLFLFLLFVFLSSSPVWAEEISFTASLNTPENLASPSGVSFEGRSANLLFHRDEVRITYRYLDSSGIAIPQSNGRVNRIYIIRNIPDDSFTDVNACSGVSIPFDPCSGVSTESPTGALDESDPRYNETMGFLIRSQDIGKMIGKALRTLFWSKIKDYVLTGGNDGTFSN